MTVLNGARKRKRLSTPVGSNAAPASPGWQKAVDTLLERLEAIKAESTALRDDRSNEVSEIDEKLSARKAACNAISSVSPHLRSDDINIFSKGVRVETHLQPLQLPSLSPMPAMKLLTEADPPEKLIHEQSVIVRAQAINRKNAELARERLPKQPEAQRNKTFHDFFLEEALWMANDFRGERKWKVHMAKRVSKVILQYHAQRKSRKLRADAEEHQRLLKLAGAVARNVRKFWVQIGQIAEYRHSVVEEAKRAKQEEEELEKLLQQTARYTSLVGKDLTNTSSRQAQNWSTSERRVSFRISGLTGSSESSELHEEGELNTNVQPGKSFSKDMQTEESGESSSGEERISGMPGEEFDYVVEGDQEMLDDESTLIAAEAVDQQDDEELSRLQRDANLSVEELLRAQGIDLTSYIADKTSYLDCEKDDTNGFGEAIDVVQRDKVQGVESTVMFVGDEGKHGVESAALEQDSIGSVSEVVKSHDLGSVPSHPKRSRSILRASEPSPGESNYKAKTASEEVLQTKAGGERRGGVEAVKVGLFKEQDNAEAADVVMREQQDVDATNKDKETRLGNNHQTQDDLKSADPSTRGTLSSSCIEKGRAANIQQDLNGIRGKQVVLGDVRKAVEHGDDRADRITTPVPMASSEGKMKSAKSSGIANELLRGTLRSYQKVGVEWLISLFNQGVNGILADEMGLGKTIQAISLLAWLATEKGIWGPHLIVVPTSVILNWEVEFKKWLPGFKILTYFGSARDRKLKRQGWTKPNTFHICITSYNLAVQDATCLRRKKWVYIILDEAHNIKNFESQRWQTLQSFPSQRRLLITGTPLQNSVMELWSLMHFLMPEVFESHSEFKVWFSKPLNDIAQLQTVGINEKSKIVSKLHDVLRPFILRRLKIDVEKGLPPKYDHVVRCPLSRRQRQLYEDFMARSDVRDVLQSGDFLSVMNVLMQLRKVCNHPDLFEGRRILSPFAMRGVFYPIPALIHEACAKHERDSVNFGLLGLNMSSLELTWAGKWHAEQLARISAESIIRKELLPVAKSDFIKERRMGSSSCVSAENRETSFRRSQLRYLAQKTAFLLRQRALFGEDLRAICTISPTSLCGSMRSVSGPHHLFLPSVTPGLVRTVEQIVQCTVPIIERFLCCITRATAPVVEVRFRGDDSYHSSLKKGFDSMFNSSSRYRTLFRPFEVRGKVTIPDTRLVQWDCGKLQVLDGLLRTIQSRGSRTLIFTQMTKVLDILESFLNLHSLRYLRLDGSTKTDDRQKVVERFNTDKKIFCLILTTRTGGVGLNLTGADTVIFFDTDYNPAIDLQAQDRVHRIGQTKSVHIYRLVSEQTVEENILQRANEKRALESLIISDAGFTTEAITSHGSEITRTACIPVPGVSKSHEIQSETHSTQQLLLSLQHSGKLSNASHTERMGNRNVGNGDSNNAVRGLSRSHSDLPAELIGSGLCADLGGPSGKVGQPGISKKGYRPAKVLTYQSVTSKLLADEDDQDMISTVATQGEQRDKGAEHCDTVPATKFQGSSVREFCELRDGIESSLSPVQQYALRFVESLQSSIAVGEQHQSTDFGSKYPVREGLSRISNPNAIRKGYGGVIGMEYGDRGISDEDDENDQVALSYEFDKTEKLQGSYLKALTDTDADIKLYLPLRDGGPEELNVSSVVSGTAAAGLECAEDAAFFPHAYNRMSRTMYATYWQKKKSLANLLRADEEARRRRELEGAAAVTVAMAVNGRESDCCTVNNFQAAKSTNASDRQKLLKNKSDASRGLEGLVIAKKGRSNVCSKMRDASDQSAIPAAVDSSTQNYYGLFRRAAKKGTRKLISASKSATAGPAVRMLAEGNGLNDAWVREEDVGLITALSHCNNNMLLLSDSMLLDPSVASGLRRRRGKNHCLDRLVSTLQKDVKNGQLIPKATEREKAVYCKHSASISVAHSVAQQRPPAWLGLPAPTEKHPSQMKVISDAATKPSGKFGANIAPVLEVVGSSITTPSHFKPGYKTTETTAEAMNRKRFPFIRSPRDEAKVGSQRSTSLGQNLALPQTQTPFQFSKASFPLKSTFLSSTTSKGKFRIVPGRKSQKRILE